MKKLTVLLILAMAMPSLAVKLIPQNATNQSISVVIVDSSGDPNASVDVTDLDLYLQRDGAGAQSTKVDLTALASADTAHTDNKAIHKGFGVVRIDLPDANWADPAGTLYTVIIDDAGGVVGNDTAYYEIQIVDPNFFITRQAISAYDIPTAAETAEAVWEDPNATSSTDVWNVLSTGSFTEDSFGNMLADLTEEYASDGLYRFTLPALLRTPTNLRGY